MVVSGWYFPESCKRGFSEITGGALYASCFAAWKLLPVKILTVSERASKR
jgi:hypothetical protein